MRIYHAISQGLLPLGGNKVLLWALPYRLINYSDASSANQQLICHHYQQLIQLFLQYNYNIKTPRGIRNDCWQNKYYHKLKFTCSAT